MTYVIGAIFGVLVTFIGFVVVMAPRHWEWYQENIKLKAALKSATEERDHYKNLVSPIQWGPQELHEARIIKRREDKVRAYDGVTLEPGEAIDFVFDDIRQTQEVLSVWDGEGEPLKGDT